MLVSCEKVTVEIKRLSIHRRAPIVVAIDGGCGSGKSTLASMVADELCAALIPLDDFYSAEIQDSKWDLFTVEKRLTSVFEILIDLRGMTGLAGQLLGVVAMAFLLGAVFLCIPGLIVGVIGTILVRRRGRVQGPAA